MIQDIAPARLDNVYRAVVPKETDMVLSFERNRIRVRYDADRQALCFPQYREYAGKPDTVYLFSVSDVPYFLALSAAERPEGCDAFTLQDLRGLRLCGNAGIFAAYTAWHLWKWYETSRYCGACGNPTETDSRERARVCPACGNRIYPRINPAVIVGVRNGNSLLITRYREGFRHNALIAGFTEIGETAEETVRREVMEEAGLKVKNIRYCQSQPWGIASDLLMGFYCDVDGDAHIRMDPQELKYAEWVPRDQIELQPSDYSLTNEMMKRFRDGKDGETPWPGQN